MNNLHIFFFFSPVFCENNLKDTCQLKEKGIKLKLTENLSDRKKTSVWTGGEQ